MLSLILSFLKKDKKENVSVHNFTNKNIWNLLSI